MSEVVLPNENCNSLILQLIDEQKFENVNVCVYVGSGKGDNYVGEVYRIKINSKSNNANLLSVILKTTPSDDKKKNALPLSDYYIREADMYNAILPTFVKFQRNYYIQNEEELFKFAKCYKTTKDVVILEDLNVKDFVMHDRYDSFDENHLKLTLISLARYHAISFAMKENQSEIFENLVKFVEKDVVEDFFNPLLENSCAQAISIINEKIKREKLIEFSADVVKKYFSYVGHDIADPYNVICHGDCWNNNILFKYKNKEPVEVIFLDWQISRYCSPVTDISYMVYCSTDKTVRDKFGFRIFDIYYEALTKQLNYFKCDVEKCYPREIFDNHIKKILPYGLIMSMVAVPIILCEKGKELDLSEMCESDDTRKNVQFNDISRKRINDIIDEFINLRLI